jgi:ABC-type amino acid transport substrate-binding protein
MSKISFLPENRIIILLALICLFFLTGFFAQTVVLAKAEQQTVLTEQERQFIKSHPTIRFLVNSAKPPFDFEENGEAAGIAVDYIRAMADAVGIEAAFVVQDFNVEDALNEINGERKEFDTLIYTVKNAKRAEQLAFGEPYLSYPMMIIGHKNSPYIGQMSDLRGKRVALEKNYLTNLWIKRDYPEVDIITVQNTHQALQKVHDRKADAYVGNVAIANYMMVHGGMPDLKLMAPTDYGNVKFSVVAPKDWPELASIMSKGYRSLPADFHNVVQQKWFSVQLVERVDYTLIWQILGVTAIFVASVLWWNRKLTLAKQQTEAALSELQKTHVSLQQAMEEIKTLREILPTCSGCSKIRDEEGVWNSIEKYIEDNTEAHFSHSLCPECADRLYGDQDWYIGAKEKGK